MASGESATIQHVARDDAWRRIRTLRARPPGLATNDAERRAVFGAALQQSEELFHASAAVSPASKPLQLFYALSQAGRAIAAAYNPEGGWRITGHGLSVRAGGDDITDTVVAPTPHKDGSDAFGSVARAMRSQALESSVTLAAVWASLPELTAFSRLRAEAVPALELRPEGRNPSFFSSLHPALATVFVLDVADAAELKARLALYAHTEGCEAIIGPLPPVDRVSQATLHWPAEPRPESTPGTKAIRALHEVAIQVDDRWFLQPLLGSPPTAPKPLLTWWVLMIALSSLARYHPGRWTAALDVDSAVTAVELEQGLAIAERRLPQLIATALEPPFRMPKLHTGAGGADAP
jgi:hypothetical protein